MLAPGRGPTQESAPSPSNLPLRPMNPLQAYLSELQAVRASAAGVKETSYYPAVSGLFNAVGKTLKPAVRCIINLKNTGAGIPDGGFFTPDQFGKAAEESLRPGLLPARGVLEVKGAGDDIAKIAASDQVDKYWARYGQVLVTNLRAFVLVGRSETGQKAELERFSLAPTEADFWALAARPGSVDAALGERFGEYLQRVLLQAAPLASPEDVAWFLASYARDARSRIAASPLSALASVRTALEEALGLRFQGEKGDHFFRSSLVQTLFYGVFSAWVLWCRHQDVKTAGRFDWRMAAWDLHVPMIRALFEEVSKPSKLNPLGLVEVLDWAGAALNRVDRPAFFARFDGAQAVQYFYEPFLQAFDPELRRELGVWYTPPEIVRYQVARVDAVLRNELDIPDGLADPRVFVLDPCCGTGAYLVEVLRHIHATLDASGGDGLAGNDLKKAATERVFGFEILPAPFVVAHLQLGLLLQNAGAPLSEAKAERVGVYLTNALTGWGTEGGPHPVLPIPEFGEERDLADQVKQKKPILVILGNPPYNSFAGLAVEEERALSTAYRTTKAAPAPQGQGLNDLYIRFFRMAERRITEGTGRGVVCFISNYSWLDGLSHTGMRERYLEAFDEVWIDCLNGDKYKTGKRTPDGLPDPSVFSTDTNREGIQVGTAIALLVRKSPHRDASTVHFRNWWGKDKRAELLASLDSKVSPYAQFTPSNQMGLTFAPSVFREDYHSWPLLTDLFPVSFPGVQTKRDDMVVDIDRDQLDRRMRQYFDPAISHEQMTKLCPRAMEDTNRFDAKAAREYLIKRGYLPQYLVRYCYRPFDMRWIYWEPETRLIGEKVSAYFPHVFEGNLWLVSQQMPRREWSLPQVIQSLGCLDLMDRSASCIPLLLRPQIQRSLLEPEPGEGEAKPNLSEKARQYLQALAQDGPLAPNSGGTGQGTGDGVGAGSPRPPLSPRPSPSDSKSDTPLPLAGEGSASAPGVGAGGPPPPTPPEPGDRTPPTPAPQNWGGGADLFYHALATLHAPAYRSENGGALRQDWPRVPLPAALDTLAASAALGRRVAALLDTETPVPGVTTGTLDPAYRTVGVIKRTDGGPLQPDSGDLRVAAGWGHGGQGGVTMPGKGRSVERPYTADETAALGESLSLLGETTRDIYLNPDACWRNVPARVWDYTLGGYQVMKKWLSYREHALLGRDLTPDEAREVTAMARRLAALRLLEPALDAAYQAAKAAAWDLTPAQVPTLPC